MRLLFVYQDHAGPARQLLETLGVSDVKMFIVRKDARQPTDEELAFLRANPALPAAACEVNRKYRKSVSDLVDFCCEPKKFRIDDVQLRDWLVPRPVNIRAPSAPSAAFAQAATDAPNLILHPDALLRADELAVHRWAFAERGARLLARYANAEDLGPMRDWKAAHGVDFAVNGRVIFKYAAHCGKDVLRGKAEWHLKEGDNTTPEGAARIYFYRIDCNSTTQVVVFYVGPHPADGHQQISFECR